MTRAECHRVTPKPLVRDIAVLLKIEATPERGSDSGQQILQKCALVPFLPRRHDQLGLGWQGDYYEVSDLFWCPEEGFTVWFCDGDGAGRLDQLRSDGWVAGS